MSLTSVLHQHQGVMRAARLRQLGWTESIIRRALDAGTLVRPKNGWLALPQADPRLVYALRRGAVLSCVTQANRLNLWALETPEQHLAAPTPHSRAQRDDCVLHWSKPLVPRDTHVLEDSIENVLGVVAICQPFEAALVIWESALNKRLVEHATLARLTLPKPARALLAASQPYSDSGLETIMRTRLGMLKVRIIAQAWLYGHRVDFLVGERLVLQIDGGHHVGAQRTSDIRHDAELLLRGYHVIRFSYAQVMHDWPSVQALVMSAVAQGLHLAR